MNTILKPGTSIHCDGPAEIRVIKSFSNGSVKVQIRSLDNVRIARTAETSQNEGQTTK